MKQSSFLVTSAGAGLLTCARPLLVVCGNLNKITMGKLKSAINFMSTGAYKITDQEAMYFVTLLVNKTHNELLYF